MDYRHGIIAVSRKSSADAPAEALKALGLESIRVVCSGAEALKEMSAAPTDVLLAEVTLPGTDGPALARMTLTHPLLRRPAMVFMTLPGYTPRGFDPFFKTGVALAEKPLRAEALRRILDDLIPEMRALPPAKADLLNAVLSELGIPDHPGRTYIFHAAAMTWMDDRFSVSRKDRLYPAIARKCGCGAAHVERSMRYAIDHAWRTGEIEHQHRIFGDTIDARRGKPTCGEMIARLAGILRWEEQL